MVRGGFRAALGQGFEGALDLVSTVQRVVMAADQQHIDGSAVPADLHKPAIGAESRAVLDSDHLRYPVSGGIAAPRRWLCLEVHREHCEVPKHEADKRFFFLELPSRYEALDGGVPFQVCGYGHLLGRLVALHCRVHARQRVG